MREADIILLCVRWYLRYALSYRDWEATSLMNDAVLFLALLFHVMFGILFLVNDAV
jgi:hypothetical protein